MVHRAQASHAGSALSLVDILVSLHFEVMRGDPARPDDPARDKLILSKGHGCAALYATLVERGYCDPAVLQTYCLDGGQLAGHPIRHCIPGVEVTSGSLGHGLSIGAGWALGDRTLGRPSRVFVVMGDGECNEGAVWEAAMFAAARGLDNLFALVDYNRLQGLGRTHLINQIDPLAEKWRTFGWDVREVDGHSFEALLSAFGDSAELAGRPRAIIAHTVKGKGVSFMEDQLSWHYKSPTVDQYSQALRELEDPA
jgi:transketolase